MSKEHKTNEKGYNHITMFLYLCIVTYTNWQHSNYYADLTTLFEYFKYAPSVYRLSNLLFINLHEYIFSYYTWVALEYLVVSYSCYLLIQPSNANDKLLLMVWFALFPVFIHCLQLLILVLIVKYANNQYIVYLLIPLIFVKELAVFQAIAYLIILQRSPTPKHVVIASGIALCGYCSMRFLLIGNQPYYPATYFFTLFHLPELFLNVMVFASIRLVFLITLLALTIQSKKELAFLFLSSLPIFMFALCWETQLWLPIALILIAHRANKDKENYR